MNETVRFSKASYEFSFSWDWTEIETSISVWDRHENLESFSYIYMYIFLLLRNSSQTELFQLFPSASAFNIQLSFKSNTEQIIITDIQFHSKDPYNITPVTHLRFAVTRTQGSGAATPSLLRIISYEQQG